ncbi:MAG: glycosyltransferase [Muribaculaceae bacterium]|nr:glycosyltransferase [Muribaculaceae bacterium]MDE6331926.1 glycosyltransferase [Muribaculaceae bacterium]
MKTVIINHSDTRGGASVVSYRLLKALKAEGADVKMLVCHKATDDPDVITAAPKWRCRIPFIAEHLGIFAANGFDRSSLFKISTGSDGLPLHRHPLVKSADAVILNWVNQGMLSLDTIRKLADSGKRIIWTMHDMWNLTGICHHAGSCSGYLRQCGKCPLINKKEKLNDLSHDILLRKKELYNSCDIHFVAVSNWLAGLARRSSLMAHSRISVIPNAFPIEDFLNPPDYDRNSLGLPAHKPLIVMGAARLDDPIKNLPMAIKALNILADKGPDAHAVFYGGIRHAEILNSLRLPFTYMGTIDEPAKLRSLMHHASAVLSSSDYETLPGTLIEGQAAGAIPVSFGNGGQSDIIDHLSSGYIARTGDADDLAAGLGWAVTHPHDPDFLADSVRRRFSARAVARRYLELLSGRS